MEQSRKITFEEIPDLMSELLAQMRALNKKMEALTAVKGPDGQSKAPAHRPISVDEVSNLIHKTKGTIYRLSCNGMIPCYKNGKNLVFFEDEIIEWLSADRRLSYNQTQSAAAEYCKSHPI